MLLFLLACTACGEPQPEPFHLTEEFYEWHCEEADDEYPVDKVIVSTETCDDDVVWIVSELHYTTGQFMKQRLYNELASCYWEATYPIVEGGCDDVAGVALTAWITPSTLGGEG